MPQRRYASGWFFWQVVDKGFDALYCQHAAFGAAFGVKPGVVRASFNEALASSVCSFGFV